MVLSLPEELTEDLHQAVTFMSQFLSWLTQANTSVSVNPDAGMHRVFPWNLQSPASKWTDVNLTEKVLHNSIQLVGGGGGGVE